MIPTRWSSAIAILRRRQAEAAAEQHAGHGLGIGKPAHDAESAPDDGSTAADDARAVRRIHERLFALWKQVTRGSR